MSAFGRRRVWQLVVGLAAAGAVLGWVLPLRLEIGSTAAGLALLASLAFVAAGVIAAARRPGDPAGALLVAIGVLYPMSQGALEGEVPWRYTAYLALDDAWLPLLAYVVLSLPAGRLTRVWDRWLVGAFAVLVFATIPFELAWTPPAADCWSCPPAGNLGYVAAAPFDLLAAKDRYTEVRTVLIGLTLGTLALRWLKASRPLRRVVGPVLLATAALAAKALADEVWLVEEYVVFEPERRDLVVIPNGLLTTAIPLAFLLGLVRARVARGGLAEMVSELGRAVDSSRLRDLLATALGDPQLRVGFWAQPLGAYVDAEGTPMPLPSERDPQVATELTGDAGPLAVLLHDRALLADRGYVEGVGAAARLSLENERLKAEVRAQLEQVSRSRARIVEASDAERRRIERDLHDGAQQRLVSLSLTLRLAQSAPAEERDALLARAQEHAAGALDELRDLARGIHPTLLTEAGLAAALQGLAEWSPVPLRFGALVPGRLSRSVESAAYFVCTEAVANAAKHAEADEVLIETAEADGCLIVDVRDDGRGGASVDRGTGLRGLSDRLDALGGSLSVDSRPGAGTHLRAVLPLSER